jgi:hypothetical protein
MIAMERDPKIDELIDEMRLDASPREDQACITWSLGVRAAQIAGSRLPRGSVEAAAGRLVAREQIEDIVRLVENSVDGIRSNLLAVLGDVAGEEVIPLMERFLEDADDDLFSASAYVLGQIGGPRALRALSSMLESVKARYRKVAVELAIESIEKGGVLSYSEGIFGRNLAPLKHWQVRETEHGSRSSRAVVRRSPWPSDSYDAALFLFAAQKQLATEGQLLKRLAQNRSAESEGGPII